MRATPTCGNEFLREYESALCVESALFAGMDDTLQQLEERGIKWGIVTNKLARFTLPLVQALNLSDRAACVVSGDTTNFSKPHPAPLLHALAAAAVDASLAIYVGDDQRDIDAGRAAGMRTVVASYGYLGNGVPYQQWGADAVIDSPPEILQLLNGDRALAQPNRLISSPGAASMCVQFHLTLGATWLRRGS